ncbi:MAG: DUF2779 domain-containing protein [Campylobacterales bacterium]|nr:DUF2779 domain-containing protein [Campylobacterales bacterium]
MIGKNLFLDYFRCPLLFKKKKDDDKFFVDKEKEAFKKIIGDFFFPNVEKARELSPSILQLELQKKKVLKDVKVSYKNLIGKIHFLESQKNNYHLVEIVPKQIIKQKVIDTIAFKYYILSQNGISVSKCSVIKITEDFEREEELDLFEFTEYFEVTRRVFKRLPRIKALIKDLLEEKEFQGKNSVSCFKPFVCEEFKGCWGKIYENSILNLIAKPVDEKLSLLKNGIDTIEKYDESKLTDFQKIQKSALKKPFVDKERLSLFLSQFKDEIYFLDFESYQPIIPFFKGMKPYEPIVFQYSIHKLKNEKDLEKFNYIANIKEKDPRYEIGEKLCEIIPTDKTVVAYGAQFERRILRDLACKLPKHKDHLNTIADNIIDLNDPFKNRYCYFGKMGAKHSLKAVLPALVSDLSYEDLIVANGQELLDEYKEILFGDKKEIEEKKEKLIKYCEVDTLALVKIYQKLITWI